MTTLDSPPIPGFRLGHPEQTPRLPFTATLPNDNLTERYRPRTLADVVGQGEAVFQLSTFLDAPYPVAFLFEGPTGVGKTSAARALASDLGVSLDSVDYFEIDSGKQDGEAVDRIIDRFRFAPMFGEYRVVVVNEADLMTPKAAHLWLSGLESIPQRTVIIFTTNFPDKFPDRFLDRCERIRFRSDGVALKQDAQALIDSVWSKETGMDDSPSVDDLPDVIDRSGLISFRRVVSALGPMIRSRRRPMPPGRPTVAFTIPVPASKPVARPKAAPKPRKRAMPSTVAVRPDSAEMLRLRNELNDLIEEEADLCERCAEAMDLTNSIRAEWKTMSKRGRESLRPRMQAADKEVTRLGGLGIALDARLDAVRAAIKRAERGK